MESHVVKTLSTLLVSLMLNTSAFADQYGGSLKKSPDSKARFRINCFDDGNGAPAEVYLDVQGRTKSAPFVIMAILEKNGVTSSVTDKINGDRKSSPAIIFRKGDGVYDLTISKVTKKPTQPDSKRKGVMVFSGTAHCVSGSGAHTGTDIVRR